MAGPINAVERALLDHIFTDPAYTPPATWYVGVSTSTPDEDGASFTEPSGNGYARVAVTAADFSAASGGAPASKVNSEPILFPEASGSWGTVTHWGLFAASSGGTVQYIAELDESKAVGNGDTLHFQPGDLVMQLGDPSDTYG